MTKLPRLFVKGKFKKILNPLNVSITLTLVPLSNATMTLLSEDALPPRSYVELFTPYGSAGMFRVRSPHDAYGIETTTAELEHMISEVGDYLVKEEASEMLAADTAMKRAFKYYKGSNWQLGSVSALGSGKIGYEAKYDRVLDVMLSILQQKPDCMLAYDFTTSPWTVKVVKKGRSVAEGRLARNVTSADVSYDDSELCTRCWYQTYNAKKEATWKYKESNVSKYGVVEGTVKTSSDMTAEEINYLVDTYLAEHSKLRASISVQGADICQITGESIDRLEPGKLYRLALPDYDLIVEDYIASMTWSDVYKNPLDVSVEIGDGEDTVVTFLHNLDAKGGGGGGGGKNKKEQEYEWGEYRSDWDKQDDHIAGMVEKIDKQGSILEQAGLSITSSGVLVYSKKKGGLMSFIDTQAERINLVVTKKGGKDVIDTARIVTEINAQTGKSRILLEAKQIDLSGYVTMKKFTSLEGTVKNLTSGAATFAKIVAIQGNIPTLTVPATFTLRGHNLTFFEVNGHQLLGY